MQFRISVATFDLILFFFGDFIEGGVFSFFILFVFVIVIFLVIIFVVGAIAIVIAIASTAAAAAVVDCGGGVSFGGGCGFGFCDSGSSCVFAAVLRLLCWLCTHGRTEMYDGKHC